MLIVSRLSSVDGMGNFHEIRSDRITSTELSLYIYILIQEKRSDLVLTLRHGTTEVLRKLTAVSERTYYEKK
jgi:hypothetical protein